MACGQGRAIILAGVHIIGHSGWNRIHRLFERRLAYLGFQQALGAKVRRHFETYLLARLHTYAITYSNDASGVLEWNMWLD